MEQLELRNPSVGQIIKKIMKINPELTAPELISIVKGSIQVQGKSAGEFASAEVINETKALSLAQETLLK